MEVRALKVKSLICQDLFKLVLLDHRRTTLIGVQITIYNLRLMSKLYSLNIDLQTLRVLDIEDFSLWNVAWSDPNWSRSSSEKC